MRKQTVLSSDGFTATADGLLYYNVVDPRAAVFDVADLAACLGKLAQTALRDAFAGCTLQECLDKRGDLADQVRQAVRDGSRGWGVYVRLVLIEDVHLDTATAKLFAADAIAQRAAAAKITEARAEVEAAKLMREAAEALNSPAAMQLRGLDTLRTIAANSAARMVFVPMPSNMVACDATVMTAAALAAAAGSSSNS
jgi:regulator of protease activity HflC (stomatin/prohibitin superfamily)